MNKLLEKLENKHLLSFDPKSLPQVLRKKALRLSRPLLTHYPFSRGRSALCRLLHARAQDLPSGEIITTRYGTRIRVIPDAMYLGLYLFGDYEPTHTALYQSLVQPHAVVFDIGANFGWYTTILARRLAATGKLHAFEPVPEIADLGQESVRLNHVESRVQFNRMGLGSAPGELTVYTFAGLPHGHASAAHLNRDDAIAHQVPITTIDQYVSENRVSHIDFIKIDVEGYEYDALSGGPNTLSRANSPVIAFETNRMCLAHRGLRADSVRSLLQSFGYRHFWKIIPSGEALSWTEPLADENSDYIAAPPARADFVQSALAELRSGHNRG